MAVQWPDMTTSQVIWTCIFKKTWQKFDRSQAFFGRTLTGDRPLFRVLSWSMAYCMPYVK
jgi:hypothetical protein